MNKIPVLILTGPTAVGKTNLSIQLAKSLNGEIISSDSMQIYRHMDVGSAKITEKEMDGIKHYLIDVVDPDEEFSVSDFREMAEKYIEDIHNRGKLPIITGGTGLYLNSLIYDMDFGHSNSDEKLRKELYSLYDQHGAEYMHDILSSLSKESADRIHPNNVKRVIRAIEIYKSGGKLGDFSKDLQYNEHIDAKVIVLSRDRKYLYDRINMRVDIMFEQGLLNEVKELKSMGYSQDMVSMKGIGYKEVLDYLDEKETLERTIEIIKQSTRKYAKRQITWFKKYKDALWIDVGEVSGIDEQIKLIENFIAK
ncbi:MAG: tRNA (adenosine(37)-N6)-dimethylallyltransferase MiaA [Peptostreptococcus sp.]|uniref:tRNA (adenosine(37)-N6)-dimethylallyltransferase MiaA n=1 Tax=Peptostreptococcus sp. TaxID=1262 RepID=UPI002FC8D743